MLTNKELLLLVERSLVRAADENGLVSVDQIRTIVSNYMYDVDNEPRPVEKFMFVEDGSVDADELTESLNLTNPEIKVIVYRQGGRTPELVDVEEGKAWAK